MRRMMAWSGIGLAVALGLPWVVVAQEGAAPKSGDSPKGAATYTVDNVHSCVVFRIKHLDISWFYGRFNEVSGTFTWDDAEPKNNKLAIDVKTASIDTNNTGRDEHLRKPDYFDAEKFPTIAFKGEHFKKTGENTFEVAGELTLHGVTKPLTVTLERTGSGRDPWGKTRVGFETTFTIKRSDFEVGDQRGLSDEVRLTVSIDGVQS